MTAETQQGQPNGNAVATKGISFGYDPIGDITSIERYTNITQAPNPSADAADTSLTYNNLGQLTSEDHTHYQSAIENLSWTFDTLGRVSTFSSNDGLATYGYDKASQVVSATYSGSNPPPNVTESYDPNGNRNGPGYVVGANNLLTSDGTFNYTHDAEGNVIKRVRISSASANDYEVDYSWDYRNRLTDVYFYNNSHVLTKHVHDVYDVFNNLIEQDVDPTGSGTFTQVTHNVWDIQSPLPPGEGQGEGQAAAATGANVGGGQAAGAGEGGIVLQFNGQQQLTNRYLNGPNTNAADQYFSTLAEEAVSSLTSPGTVTFDLADNLGSVRDVVSATGSLLDHANYDVFGSIASESNPAVHHLNGFAGGLTDPNTGIDLFSERNYNPSTGRFIQPDHIGLAGGDTNEERYVGNDPTSNSDPSGLEARKSDPNAKPKKGPYPYYSGVDRKALEAAVADDRKRRGADGAPTIDQTPPSGSSPLEHARRKASEWKCPGEQIGKGDAVMIAPGSPSDHIPENYPGAAATKTKSWADFEWQLEKRAAEGRDYETLYIVGHGAGPGTNFGDGQFRYPLSPDVVANIKKLLGHSGVVVIESCHETLTAKDFVTHYDNLADQLGYPIKVPSRFGFYDSESGAGALDGPWVIFHPKPGGNGKPQTGGAP